MRSGEAPRLGAISYAAIMRLRGEAEKFQRWPRYSTAGLIPRHGAYFIYFLCQWLYRAARTLRADIDEKRRRFIDSRHTMLYDAISLSEFDAEPTYLKRVNFEARENTAFKTTPPNFTAPVIS